MRIAEMTCTVSHNGSLRIPGRTIAEMGLKAGDHIRIAYLTDDGEKNIYREILLSGRPLDKPAREGILIPLDVLEQAEIPLDADLRVICTQGTIILNQPLALPDKRLKMVLTRLEIAEDVIHRIIDS